MNVRLEDTPSNPVTITATAGEGLTIDPLELTFSGTVARAFTVTAANNLAGGEQITVNFSADGYITKQLQITIGSARQVFAFSRRHGECSGTVGWCPNNGVGEYY